MIKNYYYKILILIFVNITFTQILLENISLGSSQFTEMEPSITVHPDNSNLVVVSWIERHLYSDNVNQPDSSFVKYASLENIMGNWNVISTGTVFTVTDSSWNANPSVAFLNDSTFCVASISKYYDPAGNSHSGVFISYSNNIFSPVVDWTPIRVSEYGDKCMLATDVNSISRDNLLYVTWVDANGNIYITKVDVLNETFSDPFLVDNHPGFTYNFWPNVIIDKNDNIFCFFGRYNVDISANGEVQFCYRKKTNEGIWQSTEIINYDLISSRPNQFYPLGMTEFSFLAPAYSKELDRIVGAISFLSTDDYGDEVLGIMLKISDDQGESWNTIYHDVLNENSSNKLLPWVSFDNNGKLTLIHNEYDIGSTSVETYINISFDGGESFPIESTQLNEIDNNGEYYPNGYKYEYIGIANNSNNEYAAWVFNQQEFLINGENVGSNIVFSHISTAELNLYVDWEINTETPTQISENTTVNIYSDIIVSENSTLILNKSSQLNFGENSSIIVYGELIINGEYGEEVVFTSESGDYDIIAKEGSKLTFNHVAIENADRIELWNQTDETTFTNCTFNNNSFVLAVEGRPQFNYCTFSNNDAGLITVSMTYPVAMPTIENCIFENNDLTGMLSGYRSIPILKGNVFTNNGDGLRVSFGSEPYLFTSGADCESQNNLFDGNDVGVRVYNSGMPWLGIYAEGLTAFEGYNRLGDNIWDVYSENTQYPIYAQKNHWQNDQNNLCDSGTPTVFGDVITDPTISGDNFNNLVHNAINNEALEDYILAASQYVALVMEDPDAEIVKWAIAGLVRTYTKMNRKADLVTLLDQIIQDYPSTISFKYASTHQITQLIDFGNYEEALEQILLLEGLYPQSELSPKHLFEEWIIAEKTNGLYRSGQTKAQITEKLILDYPEDDFGITMSFIQGTVPTPTIGDDVTTQDVFPTDFGLTSIYPNPFNPITNISYEIPEESHITISVYDLAGRKLEDLVSGTVQAGRFNTTWNAEKYSSGVYLVNMHAHQSFSGGSTPSFTTSQKVVLIK